VRCQPKHWRCRGARFCFDPPHFANSIQTVHHRHLEIHQHQIVTALLKKFHPDLPVPGNIDYATYRL